MTWNIQNELERWGSDAPKGEILTLNHSREYCKKLALGHYENFPVVSLLLPKAFRQHFYNIYAYCRWSDDLADEIPGQTESLKLLDWWEEELEKCYTGDSSHPVMIALAETIQSCDIPKKPFLDLISAFRQDQMITRYKTFEELLDYCGRSANPVGRLILYVCNEFTEEKALLSDQICTGLQLANFWQDVSRDIKIGRIYIPLEDFKEFNCQDDDLLSSSCGDFKNLMEFEVDRTREFFKKGEPLIRQLSGRIQVDIDLFLLGGLKILDKIEKMEYLILKQRPVITKSEFAGLFIKALIRSINRRISN